jgi:hypothetical protein
MVGFSKGRFYHALMKPDLRISIKDYRWGKSLCTLTGVSTRVWFLGPGLSFQQANAAVHGKQKELP